MTQTLSPRLVRRYFSKCGAREVFPISGKTGGGPTDTSLTSEGSEKISRDYHTGELNPVTVFMLLHNVQSVLTLQSLNYTRYSTPLPPLPRPCTPFLLSVNLMTPALPKKQLSWWISSRRAASFCTGSLSQSVLEHGPDTSSSVRQDIAELSVQAQCVYSSICQRTLCQSHPVAFGMTLLYTRTGNSFPGTLISIGLLIFKIYLFLL